MTTDQAARGSNYGDVISDERLATGGTTPIFGFVEDGGPYTQDTSASDYITPPELNWAVWSELIHGARGVIYFNHTFAGPEVSDDNLDQPYYQTVQPGQTVSIYTQVKNTDALVEQMAPVLNSPTALNYVSVNTPGYVNGVVDSLFSGIEVLAKDDNGQFYIFADTRDSMTQTNVAATFTLADKNATSVTVVGENRTIAVSNGVFTDTFATAATVHIYKVNDGTTGSGSTAPTVTGISDSPATGDLGAGKTVTLTLGFSSAVTVAGGKPTLTLNDGGTATYASGSGTSALTFTYAVAGGQSAASLAATAVNLGSGVTIKNSAGVAANLSLAGRTQSGPQIDTTAPAAPAISSDTVSGNIVMLKGTAAANSTVTVFDNSTKLGAAAANSSGAWTYTTGALANGSQSFNATATDGAGNVSPASSALAMTLVTTGSGASSGSDTDSSDFNGDGHSDILWQNTSGQAAIWEMNGTSQVVGGNALVGSNPGPSWKAIGTGDFNDDGHSDILWQNTNGQAAIWEMDGTNVIGGGTVSANPGPSWKAIGTGDFTCDGFSDDILWQNTSSGQVSIWEMSGNKLVGGGPVTPDPGPAWKAIGTGDFNDDGHSDVLFQNTSTGQVSIWEMDGNKLIGGGPVSPNPGPAWHAIETGDFNHDGFSDILFQNASSGQVSIWEMNGNKPVGGPVSPNPGRSWRAIGTDGGSHILFQNTSGQASIWDMSGTSLVGGGPVSPNPGPSWRAVGLT